MLSYYPSHTHILNNYRRIAGQHSGLVESQLLLCNIQQSAPRLSICANQMPSYEKILITENAKINYHLSGYGVYREESFVKLYGESIERYALLVAAGIWANKAIYKTYNEMCTEHEMLPWEYIKIFSDKDYEKISQKTIIRNITPDDVIGWLECPSLLESNKTYYVPIQCLFIGYKVRNDLGEKMFIPSFSKGSAAHTDIYKALQSAILEAVEADAFMLNWYTNNRAKKVNNDHLGFMEIVDKILGNTPYDLTLYDFSMENMPGYVFAAQLINRNGNFPFALMGCSASLDPIKAAYRATAEAATIHYLAANGPMMSPRDFLSVEEDDFLNLDSNVAYWTKAERQQDKLELLNSLYDTTTNLSLYSTQEQRSDETSIKYAIEKLKKISKYAIYLDITPVEVMDKGIKVMRVFIPELVQLSYPGLPYSAHPRVIEHGGITNDFPHPMP